MARGKAVEVGATRVSQNGYHYTKVALNGTDKAAWKLTHHIIAEKKIGRSIREDERVVFRNGKKRDLSPKNIEVREKGRGSVRRRKAQLEARIAELQAELTEINKELQGPVKVDHTR